MISPTDPACAKSIGALEATHRECHNAVIERLDKINGAIGHHEERLDQHEARLLEIGTLTKLVGRIWKGVIVAAFLALGASKNTIAELLELLR